MSKTKIKILNTAHQLFNQYGIANVTLRKIANEMGISQGNLNYHFKKREDILEALYYQVVEEVNVKMQEIMASEVNFDLKFIHDSTLAATQIFYNYRFIMTDFNQLCRENKAIRDHYRQLELKRKDEFKMLFGMLIQHGVMLPEEFEGQYDRLIQRLILYGNFWIAFDEIHHEDTREEYVVQNHGIMMDAMYPYLTPEGKKEFLKLKES